LDRNLGAIGHYCAGTTQKGERGTVAAAEVEQMIENWPAPQKNVAEQMISKYGYPNEATPTKLFWYNNAP
jgi:hypothetical protein